MKLLVVGGAGYIGSHMVKMLAESGHDVVVLDNLSTGYRDAVKFGRLVVGCLSDVDLLEQLFNKEKFDAVMHFAASSLVGESMSKPSKYYRNNVSNTLNLLDVMIRHEVQEFIFSSTAATFGEPKYSPIDEKHPQRPINPYGQSKLMVERILSDYSVSYGLNSVCLRYFNACGADPGGLLGENHDPETHLIPLVLQAASGKRDSISVFGRDYPTSDGTCIRDYIHITDLCSAHELALNWLKGNKGAHAFNLGNGEGFSVQQVIDAVKEVVSIDGYSVDVKDASKRSGDPVSLVADAELARNTLGWIPKYRSLKDIVKHAWAWEKKLRGL